MKLPFDPAVSHTPSTENLMDDASFLSSTSSSNWTCFCFTPPHPKGFLFLKCIYCLLLFRPSWSYQPPEKRIYVLYSIYINIALKHNHMHSHKHDTNRFFYIPFPIKSLQFTTLSSILGQQLQTSQICPPQICQNQITNRWSLQAASGLLLSKSRINLVPGSEYREQYSAQCIDLLLGYQKFWYYQIFLWYPSKYSEGIVWKRKARNAFLSEQMGKTYR